MVGFEGRVAVVTGAGRGLGASHARLLASRGAVVVVNDPGFSADGTGGANRPADEVVEEIRAGGGNATADYASVASPRGGEGLIERTLEEYGRVDIVVNNAGILRDKAFHNLEWGNLDAVLDVHLKGAFYVTRPAFRRMREQGYGRIVFTSSNSGILGTFGQSNYGAAKMGLVGLMNVLKIEGAKYGVAVNTIAPVARTRMTEDLLGPIVERLDPEQVSPVVAYLCSEENPFSGEVWSVSGGTVSRFFIGLTPGFVKHPDREGSLTVEDVAANVDRIRAEEGYIVPASTSDELARLLPILME